MKTEAYKLYSTVFWIFLPNFVKIDPYNFELYRFKVGAFCWDAVYLFDWRRCLARCGCCCWWDRKWYIPSVVTWPTVCTTCSRPTRQTSTPPTTGALCSRCSRWSVLEPIHLHWCTSSRASTSHKSSSTPVLSSPASITFVSSCVRRNVLRCLTLEACSHNVLSLLVCNYVTIWQVARWLSG